MEQQEFNERAGEALDHLYRKLCDAGDQYDFDTDFNSGALSIEFEEPPGKFVVSPNSPVQQIWVSAHSRSFKLDWDPVRNTFVYSNTGETLEALMAGAIATQLGVDVRL